SAHPVYGWSFNKGYSAPEHVSALRRHGACGQHRRSWSLPGTEAADLDFEVHFDGEPVAEPEIDLDEELGAASDREVDVTVEVDPELEEDARRRTGRPR